MSVVLIGVMAFHLSTERILIPSLNNDGNVIFAISTKDGNLVHAVHLNTEKIHSVSGIAVTTEGHIAVLCTTQTIQRNSEKHVVLVV